MGLDAMIDELKERIDYNPITGELIWRESHERWFKDARAHAIWNTRYANKKACHVRKDGRVVIGLRGKKLSAHRVAFAIYYGRWPQNEIDHINGNASDNRIANLRDVTKSGNMKNQKRNAANTSGVTGVTRRGGKWGAFIGHEGELRWLGTFPSMQEAVEARSAAEVSYGYHANHGRAPA